MGRLSEDLKPRGNARTFEGRNYRTFADVDGDKMVARRIGENSDARDCHGKIVRAVFIVVFSFFCRTSICG